MLSHQGEQGRAKIRINNVKITSIAFLSLTKFQITSHCFNPVKIMRMECTKRYPSIMFQYGRLLALGEITEWIKSDYPNS